MSFCRSEKNMRENVTTGRCWEISFRDWHPMYHLKEQIAGYWLIREFYILSFFASHLDLSRKSSFRSSSGCLICVVQDTGVSFLTLGRLSDLDVASISCVGVPGGRSDRASLRALCWPPCWSRQRLLQSGQSRRKWSPLRSQSPPGSIGQLESLPCVAVAAVISWSPAAMTILS